MEPANDYWTDARSRFHEREEIGIDPPAPVPWRCHRTQQALALGTLSASPVKLVRPEKKAYAA